MIDNISEAKKEERKLRGDMRDILMKISALNDSLEEINDRFSFNSMPNNYYSIREREFTMIEETSSLIARAKGVLRNYPNI